MEDLFRHQVPQAKKLGSVLPSWLFGRLLAVEVFLVILVAAGIFYFWQKSFNQDELVNFVPIDAVVYFYGRNSLWSDLLRQPGAITNLPYPNFYQGTKLDFASQLLPLSTHTAYATFLVNENLEKVWLFQLKQPASEVVKNFNLPHFKILNQKILAVGSTAALDLVAEVASGQTFSLASQLRRRSDQLRLFISAQPLSTYLQQQTFTTSQIFSQLFSQDLDMSFKPSRNIWQIQLSQNITSDKVRNSQLTTNLPAGFTVFISGINLSDIFSQLVGVDSALSKTLKQNQEIYAAFFNLDLAMVQDELLNRQSDLIVFPAVDHTSLGVEYILVTGQPSAEGLQGLEDLVKVVLAQQLPQKALRFLPDGSSVTELSANTSAWQWQTREVAGQSVRYLTEPALAFELYYLVDNSQLVLSNSLARLTSLLAQQGQAISSFQSSCPSSIFEHSYVVLAANSQIIPIPEFNLEKTVILGKNLGCIIEN